MKYYIISDPKQKVAVVFYDDQVYNMHCRSSTLSFSYAFDAILRKNSVIFTKSDNNFQFSFRGYPGYDKVLPSLIETCSSYWSITDSGIIENTDTNMDDIVKKNL